MKFKEIFRSPNRISVEGIKCVSDGCGYIELLEENEPLKSHLNKPCPNCSSNLLTQEDYDTMKKAKKLLFYFNLLTLPFWLYSNIKTYFTKKEAKEVAVVSFNMNGSGDLITLDKNTEV